MAKKKSRGANYYYTDARRKSNKKRKNMRYLRSLQKKKEKLEKRGVSHKIDGEIGRIEKVIQSL